MSILRCQAFRKKLPGEVSRVRPGGTAMKNIRRVLGDIVWLLILGGLMVGGAYLTSALCDLDTTQAQLPIFLHK
jgi:hypothetical protein